MSVKQSNAAALKEQIRVREQELRDLKTAALNAQLEEDRLKEKQHYVNKINELLEVATKALKEAGEISVEQSIEFTFKTPKGSLETCGRWVNSACYSGAGWYFEDDEHEWTNSSANC